MSSLHVTIVGGTGFVGRHLADRLLRAGHRLTLVARHCPSSVAAAPRPGIDCLVGDVLERGSLDKTVQAADAVINLVGAVHQPTTRAYFDLHETGARRVAEAAAAGARRLIHVSALGVAEDAPSAADRSKEAGERAVCAAFPRAVILRPSLMFAEDDHFLGEIAAIARRSPVIPLIGAATRVQPVHVDDMAEGVAHILELGADTAPLYQIAGAQIYTLKDLVGELLDALGRRRLMLPLPNALALPLGRVLGRLPHPPFSREQVLLMMTDKVAVAGLPGLGDLGVRPRLLRDWLAAPGGRYGSAPAD